MGEVNAMKRGDVRIAFIAAAVGATLLAPTGLSLSQAAATKTAQSGAQSISTGNLLFFATSTQTFTNPAAQLSLSIPNKNTAVNFFVQNGGSLGATGFTLKVTLSGAGTITTVKYCPVGVLFSGSGTCASGSVSTLTGIVSGTAKAVSVAVAANSFLAFQIVEDKNSVTAAIDSSVLSSQAVSGTTNS